MTEIKDKIMGDQIATKTIIKAKIKDKTLRLKTEKRSFLKQQKFDEYKQKIKELNECENKIQVETMEELLKDAKFSVMTFQDKYVKICQDEKQNKEFMKRMNYHYTVS